MSDVPSNLIPTRITGLPEYLGASTLGYLPYVIDGLTYKVQFTNIAAVGAVPSTREINTGSGLGGGGDLSANRTLYILPAGVDDSRLTTTGVTAATYGAADSVPVFTVNAQGRVTGVTNTPIVLSNYVPTSRTITAGSGLSGGGDLSANRFFTVNFSSTTPEPLGPGSPGVSTVAAREDHVHPAVDLSDTTETQGVLPLSRGGTGNSLSPVVGAVAYSSNDRLYLTPTSGNVGDVLVSAGGLAPPEWQAPIGGGTVTSVDLTAGTGISVSGGPITTSGSITVVNTAPDQIVSLTGAGLATVTGTYPNFTITASGGTGTVSSVSGTGTVSGLSLSGTVTTAGSLTLGGTLVVTPSDFASQTANTVLAAPNGSAGVPTFRAIVAADVPTLNQNTTGTASNVTGTVAIANGGTGATSAGAALTSLGAAASGANTDITSITLTTGTISTAPTNGTDIVNKTYADTIASGINFHQSVRLATVAALPANTYNNGTGGVGATLTANANGALSIDGVAAVVGNRVLVKDEATQANNGVYTVTQTGSGAAVYILTRATDFDSAGSGVDQIDAGDFFLVTAGSTLTNTSWVQQTPLPITVGTTSIVFLQFGAPITYSAGTGLSLAGTVFSLTAPVAVNLGGTGLTSVGTAGNVLTSNGTAWVSQLPSAGGITYTTVKTSNYTASVNDGVQTDTTGGAFTVTLPSSPAIGNQVIIVDTGGAWATNNLTVGRNGSTIEGSASDLICDISNVSVQLVFSGTTWNVFAQAGGAGGSGVTQVTGGGTGVATLTGYVKGSGTSPFTASATVPMSDLSGTLAIASGGTGATTAGAALTALGAAASGVNTDITALDQDVTITATGTIAADTIGYRGLPQNSQTASYTLALADQGKMINTTTGGVVIPANGSVAFPIGTAISIFNNSGSSQTISITTDTLRLAGTATTGSRTLAQYGLATCVKVAATTWAISGAGVT